MNKRVVTRFDDLAMDSSIVELSRKLGLPERFFADLDKEDDWSFIVKLHSFVEAAVTQILVYHFQEPKLIETFSRLELSNAITGKVAFCRKAGLIGKEYARFIVSLSELRNQFVHNVSFCVKKISELTENFDKSQWRKFVLDFSPSNAILLRLGSNPAFAHGKPDLDKLMERAKSNPRLHIWFGAYSLLSHLADMKGFSEATHYGRALNLLEEDTSDSDDVDC